MNELLAVAPHAQVAHGRSDGDIVGSAAEDEASSAIPVVHPRDGHHRALADLAPRTLALMHGSSYASDCGEALHALAAAYRDPAPKREVVPRFEG